MFDGLKKASIRKSVSDMVATLAALVRDASPHEESAYAALRDASKDIQSRERVVQLVGEVIVKSTEDPSLRQVVGRFQRDLMGPLPVDIVRDQIARPLLAEICPPHWLGVVVRKAVSEALRNTRTWRTRDISGIEGLWEEVKPSTACARLASVSVDPRFADL